MSSLTRIVTIMLLLLAMAVLTYSQMPVKLNGSAGTMLLKSLTKSPLHHNNTTLNATNRSANMTMPRKASDNLDSWGGKPKNPLSSGSHTGDDYLDNMINSI